MPSSNNAFAPIVLPTGSPVLQYVAVEVNGYIGLPLLIMVVVIAVRHWQSMTVRITAAMTAIMAVLSMGPRLQIDGTSTIPLPWAVFERLPLMENLLPVRLSVFTDLGIALLLAYGSRIGLGHRAQRGRAVAIVAVVITLLPSTFLSQLYAPVDVPAYFTSSELNNIPKGSIALIAPWTTDPSNDDPGVLAGVRGFPFPIAIGIRIRPVGQEGRQQRPAHRLSRVLHVGDRARRTTPRPREQDPAAGDAPGREEPPDLHDHHRAHDLSGDDASHLHVPARSQTGACRRRLRLVPHRDDASDSLSRDLSTNHHDVVVAPVVAGVDVDVVEPLAPVRFDVLDRVKCRVVVVGKELFPPVFAPMRDPELLVFRVTVSSSGRPASAVRL